MVDAEWTSCRAVCATLEHGRGRESSLFYSEQQLEQIRATRCAAVHSVQQPAAV